MTKRTRCIEVQKWSGKTGQRTKMYPTRTTGYTNDQETQFSDKFKATVALEALRGDRTAQEIAAKHKVHPEVVLDFRPVSSLVKMDHGFV